MSTLLDTCVLSELRHPNCDEGVKIAVSTLASQDLFISVISIGEITKGIALLEASKRKQELLTWIHKLEKNYSDRLLPVDLEVVKIWGEITANAQRKGRIIPTGDGLIASTAQHHGLKVMTRNISDFEPTGVMLVNPWSGD
ncbi:Toxin FitB [Acaryochloris thomasi RCC1774]|uniref:Toxin FitB n=1 Tax=Acaryochloris thomasi RCC1774 TaxID=1764569 RepID=A0A2W1JZY0_9CYAN|nr:type II toxin-antitoxin system VapC family toxin [Acaryochloris thomasi]PZD73627.1 Toxin FitB [Acaryochloris thomasi RCC1774]